MPVAQIARILVVVGRRIHGLRRSNARRRQHTAAATIAVILLVISFSIVCPPFGGAEWDKNLHPSILKVCGMVAFGIAEIAKGLLGWAKQS